MCSARPAHSALFQIVLHDEGTYQREKYWEGPFPAIGWKIKLNFSGEKRLFKVTHITLSLDPVYEPSYIQLKWLGDMLREDRQQFAQMLEDHGWEKL